MSFTRFGLWVFFAGVVVLTGEVGCLRGSALVAELKAKAKAALLNPTEIIPVEEVIAAALEAGALNGTSLGLSNATEVVNKTKSLLTGNPQKDYIYDPNLPRELNGYNLSSYPFYNGVPEDINFKCDDLHDGFYASVPHKCQVYHHCLFGTRYDFLCANYTAFDQKTFICHFVSEVDCDNSPKYYQRNEALYKAAETTTTAPLTLRQTAPPPTTAQPSTQRPRRRRPLRRRRPVYEYYYDDQYDDEEYYDDEPLPPRRKMNRKHRPQGGYRDDEDDYYDGRRDSSRGESSRAENSRGDSGRGEGRGSGSGDSSQDAKATLRVSGPAAGTVYDRPRVPPKIKRPVPIHERDKYDYTPKSSEGGLAPSQAPKKNKQPEGEEDEYYDDEYEDEYVKPPPKRGKQGNDYSMESSGKGDSRRPNNRQRPRPHSRRRPDRYEDEYEDDRPSRTRKRPRQEETTQSGRGNRGGYRGYSRDEPDPVPADRPGFISSGRFSSGNRKRVEDDRPQMNNKKTNGRVAYDDEEEEDEYYYDDEEDTHEDDASKRNHKHANNGRRSDDYEPEGRKPSNPNRKQSSNFKPFNQGSRSEESQSSDRSQGGFLRSENRKLVNKQKPDEPVVSHESKDEQCRNNCEDDYLDDTSRDASQGKKKGNSQDGNNKPPSDSEIQKQISERDRLFSSKFRENQSESKTKQQNYEPPVRTSSAPPAPRTTTQYPEPVQRYKPSLRVKPTSEETPVMPKLTTTTSSEDYSDENPTQKFSNFRSKGRIVPPTPLINNYKPISTTDQTETYDTHESESSQESEPKDIGSEESILSSADKSFVSPRPFSGIARRPYKQPADPAPVEELAVSPKVPETKTRPNYRQPSVDNEQDEKSLYSRKPVNSGPNFRRAKPEPTQSENIENNQPKLPNTGSAFRRPNKPEETVPEDNPYAKDVLDDASQADLRKTVKQSFPDKSHIGSSNYGGVYRRVKVSAISTPVAELEVSTSAYENSQPVDEAVNSNPVNNNKRPYVVVRPLLSNNPVVVDDSPKNVLSQNFPLRRPLKQRIQDPETPSTPEEFKPSPVTEDVSDNYRKPDPNLGVNLRQNFGYFPPKRVKIRIDENSGRVLDQYPKQLTLTQDDQFTKQLPKIDITAPGPSAPELDIATVKSNYNNGPQGFGLDIPEEEYDVTLNDALQPSTLHPTRSLVDYQQTRLKSRDYQSTAGRSPEYVNRGRVSYLLPAASQQVQSVFAPEGAREEKKDPEEYEAVVLTAPGDRWTGQRRNRPTEWFW